VIIYLVVNCQFSTVLYTAADYESAVRLQKVHSEPRRPLRIVRYDVPWYAGLSGELVGSGS